MSSQPTRWEQVKAALNVNFRGSEPVSPSFEGAPRNPQGVLNKKKIVWKDAEYSGSSSGMSDPELQRFVEAALPNKKEIGAVALKEFVSVAKDSLLSISALSALSAIPGAGGAVGIAKGIYKGGQAVGIHDNVEHLKDTFGGTSADLQGCSISMAKYLKGQENDKLKLAGMNAAGGALNIGTSATVVGAIAAPIIAGVSITVEKAFLVEKLWERYKAMEQGNNFLAQGQVDPTNYYNAVEACPELAAYVLATCDPGAVGAKLGNHGLASAQIAKVRKIAEETIKGSPLEIRTGEPPRSENIPEERPALVGGDAVGQILKHDVGPPRSATERVSLWKKNQVVPFDDTHHPGAPASSPIPNSMRPSNLPQIREAWPAGRPSDLPPVREAWSEGSSSGSSSSSQAYERTAVQAMVEG